MNDAQLLWWTGHFVVVLMKSPQRYNNIWHASQTCGAVKNVSNVLELELHVRADIRM